MNVLECNDPPKLDCIQVPVIVHARLYVTIFFLFLVRSNAVHGINRSAYPMKMGKKIKHCHIENSTRFNFFPHINRERSEIKIFSINNKLLSSLKLILFSLIIV